MSPVIIFRLSTPNGTAKASAVDLSRLNTLRGAKTAFLTPKRYDEHPRPFYMGLSPPIPPGMVTDQIGRHEVLLPINHNKNCNFREKKKSQEKENLLKGREHLL